jgi:hypothetical protein
MPEGGVNVALVSIPNRPTTTSFAAVVVTVGAVGVLLLPVPPLETSTGVVVSTPV